MQHANQRYVATLAVVAAAILLVGSLLRPAPIPDEPSAPVPSQADLSRLTRLAQRRSIDSMTEYFAAVAGDVSDAVVGLVPGSRSGVSDAVVGLVPGSRSGVGDAVVAPLGRSAVVWSSGLAVTTRLEPRFPDTATVTTEAGEIDAPTVGGGPHLPLAVVRVPATGRFRTVPRRDARRLDPGVWTVFVSERYRPAFTPATLLGATATRCHDLTVDEVVTSVALTSELAGAGLFDLDGFLLAVVLDCEGRLVAVPTNALETLVAAAQSVRGRIAQRYGVGLDEPTPDERAYLGVTTGLLVREVWAGYPAAAVGLAPGDVIVAINAEPVRRVDQLVPLIEPVGVNAYDLGVARGDMVVRLQLPTDPDAVPAHATTDGLVWHDPDRGHRIDTVLPETPAARAGLRAGDRLLRIDGAVPARLERVRAALAADRDMAVMLELERGPRRWAVLLP